jgi:hypothetical protein
MHISSSKVFAIYNEVDNVGVDEFDICFKEYIGIFFYSNKTMKYKSFDIVLLCYLRLYGLDKRPIGVGLENLRHCGIINITTNYN